MIMGMTITEKILAAHAGVETVQAGDLDRKSTRLNSSH